MITGSIGSLRGSADLLAYQTSKHAVLGILHGAAMYGGPLGIRVNAVAPGIVPTDLFAADARRGRRQGRHVPPGEQHAAAPGRHGRRRRRRWSPSSSATTPPT